MTKPPSRSDQLIAAMHHAAQQALAASPDGQLKKDQIHQAIVSTVAFDNRMRQG